MIGPPSDGTRGSTPGDPQQFATALAELKHTGCVVLVTGAVDATVRSALSRRLFGAVARPRQRILIHPTDTALSLASYLPHGLTPTSTAVHSVTDAQLRGDGSAVADATPPAEGDTTPDPFSIDTIYGRRFDSFLTELNPIAGTFAPSELRVGILTLKELLDQHGQTAAQTALTTVGRQMRARHGIGHCHLPVASDSDVATALAESAAIHIHLREREGSPPEQCWYLRDADCCSAWLPLDTDS
jgi:hypothetical protein